MKFTLIIKKYFFIFLRIILKFLIILSFVSIVISYYIKKILRFNTNKIHYLTEYNNTNKDIIKKYSNCKIKAIYILRENLSPLVEFGFNITTLYNLNNININYPKHISMIIDIELDNNFIKKILIEKNNNINIKTTFNINEHTDIKEINYKNKNLTFGELLHKTQERVTDKNFFNWHIKTNNCQLFVKEFLLTLNKYNKKNKQFIYDNGHIYKMNFSDISLYIINSITNIANLIESS